MYMYNEPDLLVQKNKIKWEIWNIGGGARGGGGFLICKFAPPPPKPPYPKIRRKHPNLQNKPNFQGLEKMQKI
jgi:hypothetical protein